MSILGYIAGTLIVPNLADYFISRGITSEVERKLMQKIEEEITEFNCFFEDKEVDSQYFVDFLESKNIKNSIFDRVFNSFDSVSIKYDDFAKIISKEAIEYVNAKKIDNGHPPVKDPEVFEKYFITLFNSLVKIRTSILNMSDKAFLSMIDDSIKDTQHILTEKIEQSIGNNILLNEKIINIESLIDKGHLSEAEEEISNIFESVNNISLEQRIKLLFYKVRIYIDTDEHEKIEALKNKIQSLDGETKYYYEIDYLMACKGNDLIGVNKAIQALKQLGVEDYKLQMKEVNYLVLQNDYKKAMEILINEDGEIKEIFIKEANAYYCLGVIYLNQGKFREAAETLDKAMKFKYNVAYEYNYITAKALSFFHEVRDSSIFDNLTRERAKQLAKDYERVHYFIKDSELNIRLQHWCNYLHLRALMSPEDLLSKIDDIDKDLINTEQIVGMISEAHYLLEHYNEAIPYLEEVWSINPIILMRLCDCYKITNRWGKLAEILELAETRHFDEEGIIFFYMVEIDEKKGDITNAIKRIENQAERYRSKPWFIGRVIRFSIENEQPELTENYVDILRKYRATFSLNDRINLSRLLIKTNFKSFIRELLENDYRDSEEGIALYLNSFGEANPNNPLFTELKQIVINLYENGVKNESVLNRKFFLDFMMEKYLDAYMTIQEYGEKIGKDDFYHLNNVQTVIFGSIDDDVTSSAQYLMNTSDLQYHIMAAQYFSHNGSWEEAKKILLQAFYKFSDDISEEETSGFVRVYFMNVHHHNTKVNFENVYDNTVVILRNSDGVEKKYCIHSNEFLIESEGEEKFGCLNYTSSNDVSLILKAVGKVGDCIELTGENYEVIEVLDINTFYFRYFLNKLSTEYPDNKTVIKLSSQSPKDLLEKMKELIITRKNDSETRLSLYNFGIEIGTPISSVSGKDPERYLDTIQFLLNNENEKFYSSYSDELIPDQKYVLTISSLLIINELGYLERLNKIKENIYITDSVKSFVRKGIRDAIKNSQLKGSTAFIDDDSNLRLYENNDNDKKIRKVFWTRLLTSIAQFKEMKAQYYENHYYDIIHEIVDISEFDSIFLTSSIGGLLVTDDLFISKINVSIGAVKKNLNTIGLLYNENLIDINELIEVVKKLASKKVINCINHNMLFDIYSYLITQHGTEMFEELYSNIEDIFYNLFNEEVVEHHKELLERFRELVINENLITSLLYDLMRRPFKFISYDKLI